MNIKEVKDLIHDILQSDISEFELEHTGTKLHLRRGFSTAPTASPSPVPTTYTVISPLPGFQQPPPPQPAPPPAVVEPEEAPDEEGLHIIASPIVGTFYRAPSPGAESYVKTGDNIDEGTILCIVEAMKLMNEIPSDCAGEIRRIYVENGHPVEFGQKLFGIKPRK